MMERGSQPPGVDDHWLQVNAEGAELHRRRHGPGGRRPALPAPVDEPSTGCRVEGGERGSRRARSVPVQPNQAGLRRDVNGPDRRRLLTSR